MLGLGWSEMLVVAVVVLIVVGPKDLPVMLRNLGRMMGSVRRMSNEFRREIDKAIAADEIKEAKKAISEPLTQTSAEISREFNSLRDGKYQPSGKLKPSEPGKESVVDEIRAQAGMAPRAISEPMPARAVAATQPAATLGNEPEGASDVVKKKPAKAKAPQAKAAPKASPMRKAATGSSKAKTPAAKAEAKK